MTANVNVNHVRSIVTANRMPRARCSLPHLQS
jgi:hypothetical protein